MKKLSLSILAWAAIWAFWLATTKSFHPTISLALVVTTSLIVAYAIAFYVNQYMLVPRLFQRAKRMAYAAGLTITMMSLTGIALLIIRVAYFEAIGPDLDPYGAYKHYAIDLFGMAVHLLAGIGISRFASNRKHRPPSADAFHNGK